MNGFTWAILAILFIAAIAEVSPRIGWALAGLAAMGMLAVYFGGKL